MGFAYAKGFTECLDVLDTTLNLVALVTPL